MYFYPFNVLCFHYPNDYYKTGNYEDKLSTDMLASVCSWMNRTVNYSVHSFNIKLEIVTLVEHPIINNDSIWKYRRIENAYMQKHKSN